MKELSSRQKQELQDLFGERVTFDLQERRFYQFDVGIMPSMMKSLAGSPMPAGVVQPISEQELSNLAEWAQTHRVPLTPRGKATSGYGGVIPAQGGLVVEFNRMKQIINVDAKEAVVTVQPGVVWEKLEKYLNQMGLTLRSYPTSSPASTVAGWLATGGAGIGSFGAGYFQESVEQIRLVLPDGRIRVLSGQDLELVLNASGVTGFISEITFRVKPVAELVKKAFGFTSSKQMASFADEVYRRELPLWSMSFINPAIVDYRNRMPAKPAHGGQPSHPVKQLPEQFLLLAVFDVNSGLEEELDKLAGSFHGQVLSADIAEHEWEERFHPMKAKRLSPSLIPAEVVVPSHRLGDVLAELERKIHLPFLLEGFAVKGGDIVLLGFIPHDERRFGFNVAFALSLTVLKIALNHGGRAYGCGLYFAPYAEKLLGRKALDSIKLARSQHDRNRIMNPGKTVDIMPIARLIKMALPLEGAITPVANLFSGNQPGEDYKEQRGLPGDLSWFSYACAQCGYCVDDCTQYYGRGWESQSPRGKWRLLKMVADGETRLTQQDVDTFIACTTCEVCNERCQLELPIESSWFKVRGMTVNEGGFRSLLAFHIMEASAKKEWNIWAHYSADRDQWLPDDLRPKIKEYSKIAFFPGCTSSYVEQDIAQSVARLLDKAGVEYTYLGKEEACCGIPMLMSGRWDTFEQIMQHNMEGMARRGVETIITTCPACRLVWDTFYKRWTEDKGQPYHFRAKHYSEIIAEKIAEGSFKIANPVNGTITYHDPCHMGRASGVYEEPRTLLQAIPGIDFVDMKYNRENSHCCGSVMSLVADPDAAGRIGNVRINDAREVGADTIITACPCCRVQLKVSADYNNQAIQVRDLASFVAQACGFEIPDSTPEIENSWATFDIMIRMMTPSGMAAMMAEMLDDMIEAMPAPMAAMMKWVKRQGPAVRGTMISMMKPMMPKLFPILLPGMMPKVMPKMLEMVKSKVPMPDFMAEQMPDLMPPAMVELMPKMLPDIIPHFMPLMIEYLNGQYPQQSAQASA